MVSIVGLVWTWSGAAPAATNMPRGDIDDFGGWATAHNRDVFMTDLSRDMTQFAGPANATISAPDYVPVEAKVGLAFMAGLTLIGDILDNSLVRFVSIFLVVAYAFWILFETYQMMREGQNIQKLGEDILKKGVLITVWILIIEQGPAQIFVWILGPVVGVGTYLSDLILNAVGSVAGVQIPDTCAAVHAYAAANMPPDMMMTADAAANLMCVPTRLSGFFYAAAMGGWKWMIAGIGHSAVSFVLGAAAVVVFIYDMWKFALMALGVIADLFLAMLMLPFTAIAETVSKTSYKGIAGDIFNGFLGLFKAEDLNRQIMRFINAAIYFVSLSIVIAVCAALLAGVMRVDASGALAVGSDGFIITLITGLLIAHMANKADATAREIGGEIDGEIDGALGAQFEKDLRTIGKNTVATARKWWAAIRKK